MNSEFDDVLSTCHPTFSILIPPFLLLSGSNQPTSGHWQCKALLFQMNTRIVLLTSYFIGLGCYQGRLCWRGTTQMFLPVLVCVWLISWWIVYWHVDHAFRVGRPKHVRIMAGAVEGDTFIGRKAQEYRGLLKIRYPLEHGIVTDWEDMERIWQYIYTDELKTLSEEV